MQSLIDEGDHMRRLRSGDSAKELARRLSELALEHRRDKNFGYVEENIALLCASCHDDREAGRRIAS